MCMVTCPCSMKSPIKQGNSKFYCFANQRTSGPVNAHLTPGPGIYSNAFIYVYSPRAGTDNPLGTNDDVNRKPLSLCPFVSSFKTISLKYDFKHILYDFIHVYSPRAGRDNPLGTNFDVNRNSLSLCPFVASLKKISCKSDFLPFFMCFFHMYIAPGRGRQPIGNKNFMTTERPFLFANMMQVSKWSLQNLLYTFFLILYIALGQGQETLCGQTFDVNRKPLTLQPFVASFKQISLNSDFIHIF